MANGSVHLCRRRWVLERWQKFVFLVALSGATATTRMPLGPILADADTRAFFHSLMREVVAVGRAKGVQLRPDFADDRMLLAESSPPTFKASMVHDLERGNRLELDWLAGKVVEMGRAPPSDHSCDADTREALARAIMDLAAMGLRDPHILRESALQQVRKPARPQTCGRAVRGAPRAARRSSRARG